MLNMILYPWLLIVVAAIGLIWMGIAWARHPLTGIRGFILILLFAPLYPVPGIEYVFYTFAIFSSLMLLIWLISAFRKVIARETNNNYRPLSIGLKNWLLMCFLGLPLSLLFNRGHLSDRLFYFIKGFLPFWYLCSFFIVWRFRPQAREAERILRSIIVTAAGFAVLSWVIYAVTGGRVTWFYHPLAFPFIVLGANVAFVYFLSSQKLSLQLRWAALIGFFLAAIVFTFTKAQMIALLCGFALVVAVLQGPSHPTALRKSIALVFSGLLIGIVLIFSFAHNEVDTFTDILSARITDAGTTGTRLEEWKDALLEFTESPIIGKGVGFQLERTEFDETITAGYVHNQVVYTAMTMGIIGLGLYIFILSQWVRLLLRARFAAPQQKTLLAGCHACILSLLTYSLMFAGFRTIQHNYLLGVLLALTATLTPKFEAAAGD
jgi:O-antigen ligase